MSKGIESLFRWLRVGLSELHRVIEVILRRLKDAQDLVTESVKGSLPSAARQKFAVAQRVAAKMIDLLIVGMVGVLLPTFFAPIAGFIYSLVGDGLNGWGFRGQSVGKRLMGLKVVRVPGGEPMRMRDSTIRNLPIGVATFFAIIPLWGWIICILVGVPLMLIEITLMLRMKDETRLGDIMAGTRVVPVV
jgi:uncharacterized RDD family membrane protein YckC